MSITLPIPNNLDTFLTTVRAIFADSSARSSEGGAGGSRGGHFNLGQMNLMDVNEFAMKSTEILQRNSFSNLTNALDALDGSQHTIGVTVIFCAILRQPANITDWEMFYNRIVLFISDCSPEQVKNCLNLFSEMCHHFTEELIKRDKALHGLMPISSAIKKMQSQPLILTSVHSDLCKLCLKAKSFGPALDILRGPEFIDISKDSNSQNAKYILLYFYYGGMIFTAIKDFNSARYLFEMCVTMPAVDVSHIMLEAYKKFLLVNLISEGHKSKESASLPKYTSNIVVKFFKQLSAPYTELTNAYYANNVSELQTVANKHTEVFTADENLGLVKQVIASQTKTIIQRLTKTFLTLSLEELANRVGLESPREAEKLLFTMIQDEQIHATISQKDGMVRFDTAPTDRFNSPNVLKVLEQNVSGCIELDKKITKLDEDIMLNPHFIKKSNQSNDQKSHPGEG